MKPFVRESISYIKPHVTIVSLPFLSESRFCHMRRMVSINSKMKHENVSF